MTLKVRITLVVGVTAVAMVAIGPVVVPRFVRAWNYRSAVVEYAKMSNLSLMPVEVSLPASTRGEPISLGYATFVCRSAVTSLKQRGTAVTFRTGGSLILFMAPFHVEGTAVPKVVNASASERAGGELLRSFNKDPVEHFRRSLVEQPMSLLRAAALDSEAFTVHRVRLWEKAIRVHESTEVLWFQNDRIEGVVFVGKDGTGTSTVELWSRGQPRISQGIHLESRTTQGVRKQALELLASYSFTVERIPADDELRAVIADALPNTATSRREDE